MLKKLIVWALSALLAFSTSMTPAHAVVSGEYVIDPMAEAPWAISIWVTPDGSEDDGPQFNCSGTLYKSQFVLTAAHCFQGIKGTFYIEYGADTLGKGKKYPIDAYWSVLDTTVPASSMTSPLHTYLYLSRCLSIQSSIHQQPPENQMPKRFYTVGDLIKMEK